MNIMHSGTVPPEFVGQARDARRRLELEIVGSKVGAMMRAIAKEIRITANRRRRHHRTAWRENFLDDIAKRWGKLPSAGTLGTSIQHDKKCGSLMIIDDRVTASRSTRASWDGIELSFSIARTVIDLADGRCRIGEMTTVMIGLHAVARWYQRSFDRSDASLMRDFALLAKAAPDLLAQAEVGVEFEVAVQTPEGPPWRCVVIETRDDKSAQFLALHARTSLEEGAAY
ncbi:MAG: hypothetical protein P4L90_10210 [Rhodopila sp.]|nr:hypothetical protein [Rhodopila sp.]